MKVRVACDRGFFSYVIGLQYAEGGDYSAFMGVDCALEAAESVGVLRCKFGAEELSGSRDKLYDGVSEKVTCCEEDKELP